MKRCKICNFEKDESFFSRVQKSSPYLRGYCKSCHVEDSKKRQNEDPEQANIRKIKWAKNNADKIKENRNQPNIKKYKKKYDAERYLLNKDKIKLYQAKNKQRTRDYEKYKSSTDVNYRLAKALRRRLHDALKKKRKGGSAVKNLGCSIAELKIYIESKFKKNMTWDNWNHTGWHIDHIVPLARFDLSNPEQIKYACHYTNLQPLWAEENHSKSDSLE